MAKFGDPKAKSNPPPQPPDRFRAGKVATQDKTPVSLKFNRNPYSKKQSSKPSPCSTI